MIVHELKIKRTYFEDIKDKLKTFEIRKNDRDFMVGDILHLREIEDETDEYTGLYMFVQVEYLHEGLGLQEGYVCMTIKEVELKQLS